MIKTKKMSHNILVVLKNFRILKMNKTKMRKINKIQMKN